MKIIDYSLNFAGHLLDDIKLLSFKFYNDNSCVKHYNNAFGKKNIISRILILLLYIMCFYETVYINKLMNDKIYCYINLK